MTVATRPPTAAVGAGASWRCRARCARGVAAAQALVGAGDEAGEEVRLHDGEREVGDDDEHPADRAGATCRSTCRRCRSARRGRRTTANTTSEPSAESTGNHASVLSDRSTAHERLAISHEVWNRLMPTSIDDAATSVKSAMTPVANSPCPRASRTVVAPGRVNLMGDHTDYNDGFVLPLAIDRACTVGSRPPTRPGVGARAVCASSTARSWSPPTASADPATVEPAWGRFVAGVVRALAERGMPGRGGGPRRRHHGARRLGAVVELGAGGRAHARPRRRRPRGRRRSTPPAPRRRPRPLATGVPGGLMDQLASLFGRAGHALLIDCRSTHDHPDRAPAVGRGARRALRGAPHARRDRSTRAGAPSAKRSRARSGSPRCATRPPSRCATRRVRGTSSPRTRGCWRPPTRSAAATCRCSARCCSRATPACATTSACRRPSSTRSSTCSCTSGAAGARLTGAGFGGCVVALAQRNHADDVLAKTTLRYRDATGIEPTGFVAHAVDGARVTALTRGATSGRAAPPSSARTRRG